MVSIRSPHKSKGRHESRIGFADSYQFQSAPLTKARGDWMYRSIPLITRCFNPLPSQKQGETAVERKQLNPIRSFNPLPSQKQGETAQQGPVRVR